MKKCNFKKYIYGTFFVFILIVGLYISFNYKNISKELFSNSIYSATTKASSTSTKSAGSGNDMTELLARLINGEARGETYQGQVAVGAVVLNRVKSSKFPNTIPAVIYQKGQFSCVTDGQFDKKIDSNSTVYKAAKEALSGIDPTNGALYFYNPKTAKSKWLFSLKTVATIGNHRFAVEG